MTPAEFKRKWARYSGKETSAYQEHFNDLCRLVGQETPAEADSTGTEWFCFQKRVVKDLELLTVDDSGSELSSGGDRGFADVWRKDYFAWEYKGKKKNLDEAYRQLLRYRESLLNPPLLVVCDFDRYVVRTNFNGTVQETHGFSNDQIDRPENLRLLRAVLTCPESLKPKRTTAEVTEELARVIAEVALSLQRREAVELADARSRAEMKHAQRNNLRIARFLNRIVFCFFAENTGLLPPRLFGELLKTGLNDPQHFARSLENLFAVMARGGAFGKDKIRYFNGHLFEDSTVFELTEAELAHLVKASESDWQFIQPSIMGTLFERALEPEQRAQLGAHYTSETDIRELVEPVLMAPFRRKWIDLKKAMVASFAKGKGTPAQRSELAAFQKRLSAVTILDPACGSGNFLYVSLQSLLDLEKEVVTFATQLCFKLIPQVSVQQLSAIEINPYAYELAQVSVQIGFLQWRRDNGFDNDRSPVLQNLDGFQNEDALLVPHFHSKARSLKEAQAGEHVRENALKFYTEREWPRCDVIVGNPPFLGGKFLRRELGDDYVGSLFSVYENDVEPQADLCCYWYEKARQAITAKRCSRAGLLATQGIRGGANRETLKRIKETGDIFFAVSDREWVLDGASVHISMIGFDDGSETERILDRANVTEIHSNLTSQPGDTTLAIRLHSLADLAYMGDTKGGAFDVDDRTASDWLLAPNPTGRPNSDVLLPWANGLTITRRMPPMWIVDFGLMELSDAKLYKGPFAHVNQVVRPEREENKREAYAKYWWRHVEPRPAMLAALDGMPRFAATVAVAKHHLFVWLCRPLLPDHALFAFANSEDWFIGILQSRFHEIWALKQGTRLETRPRYTPTTCFETFPFPFPFRTSASLNRAIVGELESKHAIAAEDPAPYGSEADRGAIGAAAKELNELRDRWLNPPELTKLQILEFPGSVEGPWSQFIDPTTVDRNSGLGLVRYTRIEARDTDCSVKLQERTLTGLYNEHPTWLVSAHKKLDEAVAAAYGWPADLNDEQIVLRLLALNHASAQAETARAKSSKLGPRRPQRQKNADELI